MTFAIFLKAPVIGFVVEEHVFQELMQGNAQTRLTLSRSRSFSLVLASRISTSKWTIRLGFLGALDLDLEGAGGEAASALTPLASKARTSIITPPQTQQDLRRVTQSPAKFFMASLSQFKKI